MNASNGRYCNLELPGHAVRVIGWDGGLLETPYETLTLLIAPGERYDVLVELADAEGDALELRTQHYDRRHEIPDPGPIELLAIDVDAPGPDPTALPTNWGTVPAIAVAGSTPRRRWCCARTTRFRTTRCSRSTTKCSRRSRLRRAG